MKERLRWPEEVPILSARDIHRGDYESPDRSRRCLSGWCRYMAEGCGLRVHDRAATAIRREIRLLKGVSQRLVRFNDDPENSKALIAKVWNRAMARLGYTEGNPEA